MKQPPDQSRVMAKLAISRGRYSASRGASGGAGEKLQPGTGLERLARDTRRSPRRVADDEAVVLATGAATEKLLEVWMAAERQPSLSRELDREADLAPQARVAELQALVLSQVRCDPIGSRHVPARQGTAVQPLKCFGCADFTGGEGEPGPAG